MSPQREQSGSETILVVDDEAAVLSIASAFLARCGYDVLQANSGAEALEICGKRDSVIHLLLTDVTMPNMTGPQLAGRIQSLHPEMCVMFMSGYRDDQFIRQEWFLQKPFTPDALVALVRQALDEPRKREPGRQESGREESHRDVRKVSG